MKNITKVFNTTLHAFIAMPLLVTNLPISFAGQAPVLPSVAEVLQITLSEKDIVEESLDAVSQMHAENIDAYFSKWDLPLAGYGEVFVEVAHKYDLDPYLLPAIAMRETTGGKHLCRSPKGSHNPFGYGSCKIGFDSFEHAIDTVGKAISGNNPKIAYAYEGKDVRGILETYNPPSVVPTYAGEVMSIMKKMASSGTDTKVAVR